VAGGEEKGNMMDKFSRLAVAVLLTCLLLGFPRPQSALAYNAADGFAIADFATGFADTYGGNGPIGLAFDSSNNLFVMDTADGNLYEFGPAGGTATTPVNVAPIDNSPAGIAFGKDGRLYLARQSTNDVVELDPSTGAIIRTVATDISCATGIATDPLSGDLFVSGGGCASVVRISNFANGPGTVTTYASPGNTDGLTFAPDGTLYAALFGSSVIKIAGTSTSTPGAVTLLRVG